jgi:hypothetical protein
MLCDIPRESGLGGAQLAPGDFAVVIRVDSDRKLCIAKRDFQRATQCVPLRVNDQEPAAGDMR